LCEALIPGQTKQLRQVFWAVFDALADQYRGKAVFLSSIDHEVFSE